MKNLPTICRVTFIFPVLCAACAFVLGSACSDGSSGAPSEIEGSGGHATLGPDDDNPIVKPRDDEETGSGGMGGDAGVPDVPPLRLCETVAGYSVSEAQGDPLFDDFDDGDNLAMGNGRVGYWYTYGDGTGVLDPTGGAQPTAPGRNGSGYALHATAQDFTYWGAGVGVGLATDGGQECLHDLSAYAGVSLWVRGHVEPTSESGVDRDEGVVRLMFVEADVTPQEEGGGCKGDAGGCWDSHRVRFEPNACWQLVSFDFSEFEQDGWGQDGGELDLDELFRMNIEVAAYNDWELWIDDISFYTGQKPVAPPECDMTGEGGAGGQ